MTEAARPATPLKTILLVDDEEEILQLETLSLRSLPVRISSAPDGEAALAWLRDNTPDLIVLDVMLPRLGGVGVYEAMTKDERLSRIPVLVVSVVYSDENLIRSSALARLPSIRKPFSPIAFADRVRSMLGLPLR